MNQAAMLADPFGWFQVCWSADLPAGGVQPVRIFGRHVVVYRGETGALHAVDAFCLHQGVHLGFGSAVDGDEIVCPSHGWRWGPDGANTHVPGADRPTVAERLGVWHVEERQGCVYVWRHPARTPPSRPVADMFAELPDATGRTAADYLPPRPAGEVHMQGVRTHPSVVAVHAVARQLSPDRGDVRLEGYDAGSGGSAWRSSVVVAPGHADPPARRHLVMPGPGVVFALEEGGSAQRRALAVTPTGDGECDVFLTTWLPHPGAATADLPDRQLADYRAAAASLPERGEDWAAPRPKLERLESGAEVLADLDLWLSGSLVDQSVEITPRP